MLHIGLINWNSSNQAVLNQKECLSLCIGTLRVLAQFLNIMSNGNWIAKSTIKVVMEFPPAQKQELINQNRFNNGFYQSSEYPGINLITKGGDNRSTIFLSN